MPDAEQAQAWLREAELIVSAEEVARAVDRVAAQVTQRLSLTYPLVLSVMGGGVVFSGQLLPKLAFPLDLDIIRASRYGAYTTGKELKWTLLPQENVSGRTVLVVDDILDEGHTLAAIRDMVMGKGAAACYSAVFCEKDLGHAKPIAADFVGITVPNRYVFGFGMDVKGAWRNLPAVYALREPKS